MKMKRAIAILLTITLLLNINIICFAENFLYKKNQYLYNEEEYKDAVKIMYQSSLQMEGIISDYKNPEKDIVVACKLNYIYKNVCKELKNGEYFDNYFEEQDCWTFITEDGDSVIAIKKNGKYEQLEWVKPFIDNQNFIIDFEKVEKSLQTIGTTLSDENLVIKLVSMEEQGIYRVVYIRYKDEQFFIPFSNNAHNTGLKNGTMYTLNEMISYLEKSDEDSVSNTNRNDEILYSGSNGVEELSDNGDKTTIRGSIIYVSFTIVILLCLGLLVKKKKTKQGTE